MMHLANRDENYKILNVESQVQILLQFTSSEKIIDILNPSFTKKSKILTTHVSWFYPKWLKYLKYSKAGINPHIDGL